MLIIIAYLIPLLALLIMLIILLQGKSRHQNLTASFRLLLVTLILWTALLWISDQLNNPPESIIALRFALALANVVPAVFFYLGTRIINRSNRKILLVYLTFSLIFVVLSFSPYMVRSIIKGQHGVAMPHLTIAFYCQSAYMFVGFVFTYLWIRYKTYQFDKKNIPQIKAMGNGMIGALIIGTIGGLLSPSGSHLVLPDAMTILAISMFIAIFRHGLFDIRLIVARSVAYIFSLTAIGVAFGLISYGFTSIFIHTKSFNANIRIVYTVIAILLAFIFPQVKKYFDRVTRSVFYRDGYDLQIFLDNFNKTLATKNKLNELLSLVAIMIEDNLKPTYCLFGLLENEEMPKRIIGPTNSLQFEKSDIDLVHRLFPSLHRGVVVTELLEQRYSEQQSILESRNISIIARLASSNEADIIGYLILGPKKSGSMYTSQDIKVIEIVSNALVLAIQNSLHTEEIEHFNATLQSRITKATHKLRSSNNKLRALDVAKDEFLSMASHQLRTPLTSIKGNISLVLDGDTGAISDIQRQMLQQAFGSSQRMVYLIANLLNVSRIQTGKFIIEKSPVNLATVVEEEVSQLQDTAKSRNLTMSYVVPEHIDSLMLDETKTRQVVMNLVDNAIYYTPPGGRIDVVLSETENSIEFRVTDNGIGVPKNEQHQLFTKFYRASNARKARPDGTGLGLFMAKKVIVSEGGSIIIDTKEGKGSTFGFSFPKAELAVYDPENFSPANMEPVLVRQ